MSISSSVLPVATRARVSDVASEGQRSDRQGVEGIAIFLCLDKKKSDCVDSPPIIELRVQEKGLVSARLTFWA